MIVYSLQCDNTHISMFRTAFNLDFMYNTDHVSIFQIAFHQSLLYTQLKNDAYTMVFYRLFSYSELHLYFNLYLTCRERRERERAHLPSVFLILMVTCILSKLVVLDRFLLMIGCFEIANFRVSTSAMIMNLLSITHTHTHMHVCTYTHTHRHIHTHSQSVSLSLSLPLRNCGK